MNPFDLKDKTVFVTGASSGLGMQTAITASEYGARLVITGRNAERLEKTFKALKGEGHMQILADLTIQEDIDRVVSQLPMLNGVVYSTGISDLFPARFISKSFDIRSFPFPFPGHRLSSRGGRRCSSLCHEGRSNSMT